jgi:hypothetical protein
MQPLPWTSLKKIHDMFASVAKGICDGGSEVAPQLIALHVDDEGQLTHSSAFEPELVLSFFSNGGAGKDLLARFLKDLLTEGHPVRGMFQEAAGFEPNVLVQTCESWVLTRINKNDQALYLAGKLRASESPDRQEAVLVTVHTRQGSVPVFHLIETEPRRKCVLRPFPSPDSLPHFSGRFALQDAFGADGPKH